MWERHLEKLEEIKLESAAHSLVRMHRELLREHKAPSHRVLDMIAMRQRGLTLREIGDHFGITRERVRQILKPHHIEKKKKEKELYILVCENCGVKFTTSRQRKKHRFCSNVCRIQYGKEHRVWDSTKRKEYHRINYKKWVLKKKTDPYWGPIYREAIRRRNNGERVSLRQVEESLKRIDEARETLKSKGSYAGLKNKFSG